MAVRSTLAAGPGHVRLGRPKRTAPPTRPVLQPLLPPGNNPYTIIFTSGPDAVTEATFPVQKDGTRRMHRSGLLIIGEQDCDVTNRATGTWIGDNHKAWGDVRAGA